MYKSLPAAEFGGGRAQLAQGGVVLDKMLMI